MASPDEQVLNQFFDLQESAGIKISLKHNVVELAEEENMDELAAYVSDLTESEHYDFILAARRRK